MSPKASPPTDPLEETFLHVQSTAASRFEHLGTGRQRAVFRLNEDCVLKVPISAEGQISNWVEAHTYQSSRNETPCIYAACRPSLFEDLPCLEMEFVEQGCPDPAPDWTDFIDCRQIGWTRDGRLVAYDYGIG